MEIIRSYKQLRESIQWDNELCNHLIKNGCSIDEVNKVREHQKKKQKESAREFYRYVNKWHTDPLSVPIRNNVKEWRTVYDPKEGDTRTDFIIIPDKWSDLWGTDQEQEIYDDIEDFVFSTVGYHSAYDFPTGKMITINWYFHRTPCGIAIVHRAGIDW